MLPKKTNTSFFSVTMWGRIYLGTHIHKRRYYKDRPTPKPIASVVSFDFLRSRWCDKSSFTFAFWNSSSDPKNFFRRILRSSCIRQGEDEWMLMQNSVSNWVKKYLNLYSRKCDSWGQLVADVSFPTAQSGWKSMKNYDENRVFSVKIGWKKNHKRHLTILWEFG